MLDLSRLLSELEKGELAAALSELIVPEEIHTLRGRVSDLLETAAFPEPGARRSFPWPPV